MKAVNRITSSLRQYARQTLCALPVAGAILMPSVNAEPVRDLPYGVALYHYFQNDYFAALIELNKAKQQQTLHHHQQSATLLTGGISLSYGLDKASEQIFTEILLATDTTKPILSEQQQNKAWFYLGKLIYQQKDYPRSAELFSHIRPSVNAEPATALTIEAFYLQAVMALKDGALETALDVMQGVPADSMYWPYYHFNVAAYHTEQGRWTKAIEHYEIVDGRLAGTKSEQALRDKANTAAGFAYIAQQNYGDAAIAFRRVGLNSPVVDKALLGYGLAESERERYQQALVPWQALRKQSLLLPSVQEVLLALPYAYEKLGALTAALSEYELATELYRKEIAKLNQAVATFEETPLKEIFSLTGLNQRWLSKQELPPVDANTLYITHLISRHSFQAELRDYYDLSVLADNLGGLEKKLANLAAVDDEQNEYWAQILAQGKLEQLLQSKSQLSQQLQQLNAKLAHIKNTGDSRLITQGNDFELSKIIDRAKRRLDSLSNQQVDISAEERLLQRFENLLLWQRSEAYAENVWAVENAINKLEHELGRSDDAIKQLSKLISVKHKPQFTPRLTAIHQRLNSQKSSVTALLGRKELLIRQLAIEELLAQKQQLQVYLARSTLSVARLYDLGREQQEMNGGEDE